MFVLPGFFEHLCGCLWGAVSQLEVGVGADHGGQLIAACAVRCVPVHGVVESVRGGVRVLLTQIQSHQSRYLQ